MVHRKYVGELCAYCRKNTATTIDHVFSRKFFLEQDRGDYARAPACKSCNGEKSSLELYLTAVFPFGGRHQQALENLQAFGHRRLGQNQKLRRSLAASVKDGWLREENGIYRPTSMFELDGEKVKQLVKYIAQGLAWYHWSVYLRPEDGITVLFMPDAAGAMFSGIVNQMTPAACVNENLGNGTIEYVGRQAPEPRELTIWTIRMYRGIVMSDGRTDASGDLYSSSMWWAITGPPEVQKLLAQFIARNN